MTVANNYKPIKQVGNGNTTSFSFDFPVITESEVEVYQNIDGAESLVDNNSYTITLNSNGGVIDFATAPAQGVVVAIVRNVDLTQETPFLTSSGFPADRVEDCFDKLTMITQQQQQVLDRCVKVEVTDDQKPEELIDKVFEQLDLAITTGEAAIEAAEQAKEAATSAQSSAEMAENVAETAVSNINTTAEEAINEIKQQGDKITSKITVIEGAIGDIGFAPLGIDETQNKRRYLNGQVINQSQFESFTNKIKEAVALYPNIATSETNWQAEVTNSQLGQCGKFVIDDTLGTIRLPKVINIQGLQDLTNLGEIVNAGLPNLEGWFDVSIEGYGNVDEKLFNKESSTAKTAPAHGGYTTTTFIFDASRYNEVYGNSDTVQQEAIQYPYFIQVATGVEESVDVTREIELNNPFSLLDYKWSEYELNNASWLLSNGAFHSGATYVSVYELLLKIHNGTETKDGVSVKLSTEEYTDTDFVLNTTDTTFRLPIKVKLASGNAVVGNGMTLGLTDGTENRGLCEGESNYLCAGPTQYGSNIGIVVTDNPGGGDRTLGVTTDPTKSGIETSSQDLKLYFYVGETIQDANVINASGVLTRVANSIDRTVASDRETVVGWGMPDYSAGIHIAWLNESVTIESLQYNFYYQTPSDGFIVLSIYGSNGREAIAINDSFVYWTPSSGGYFFGTVYLPVAKGEKVRCSSGDSRLQSAEFFPLKGVK